MKKHQTYVDLQTFISVQAPDCKNLASTSPSQDKIHFRRKRVNQLRLRGYTYEEIANMTGCSIATIERDFHEINELSRQWFEEESIKDFCQSLHDSIILCDNAIEDLQILYSECDEIESKLRILSMISDFEERKYQLYSKSKAIQNFLRGNC